MADRPEIERLSSEIEELFSELWQVPRFARTRGGFLPSVDCFRTDEPPVLTVVVELPGVDPADVEVVASPGALVVTGERRRPAIPGRHYQQMELDYGRFQRRIALDPDVDIAQARATYDRGLLTVVMPVARRTPRPRTVAIEVRIRS